MARIIRNWRKYVKEEKDLRELEKWLYEFSWLDDDGILVLDKAKFKSVELFETIFGLYFENFAEMIKGGEVREE